MGAKMHLLGLALAADKTTVASCFVAELQACLCLFIGILAELK